MLRRAGHIHGYITIPAGKYKFRRFEYFFVDEVFDRQYRGEYRFGRLVLTFAVLAIFLATLGLLGLISYIVIQRTKEIGVRKVIGASVKGLIYLVSKEFFLLVAIGTIISFPFAWYLTEAWLQNFAYRIELINEWQTFFFSALLASVITLATVSFHVVRAASANPVNALREQ